MRLSFFSFLLSVAAKTIVVDAQALPEPCFVCGSPDMEVANPDTLLENLPDLPGVPEQISGVSCGNTQTAGLLGLVTELCGLVSMLGAFCECVPITTPTTCSVCGEGMIVGNAGAYVEVPESLDGLTMGSTCGTIQALGSAGQIPAASCAEIPALIADSCGCIPDPFPCEPDAMEPIIMAMNTGKKSGMSMPAPMAESNSGKKGR